MPIEIKQVDGSEAIQKLRELSKKSAEQCPKICHGDCAHAELDFYIECAASAVEMAQNDAAVMAMAFHDAVVDQHHDEGNFQGVKQRYISDAMAEMKLVESLLPHVLEVAGMK